MNKNILFVDDEKQILKSFKRLFLQSEYTIFLAESGKDALNILAQNPINLVITDMRMPNMDGLELLEQIKKLYPSTLRVILSGYAEEQQILKALQNNLARMYIFKPWVNEDMVNCIKQMIEFEEMLREKHLLSIINRIDEFPTFFSMYNKVCALIENKADIEEIAKVILEDPAIVVKILYIVNSSFYGLKTGSIKHAISYLGLNNLSNIVLTANLFSIKGAFEKEAEVMWKYAKMANKLTIELYRMVYNEEVPDSAATAGLLHDIGKILMLHFYKEEYVKVLKSLKLEQEESFSVLEKKAFGSTHQETGGVLLNWWGLPHPIVEAAFFHHTPFDARIINKNLIYIIHIVNYYGYKSLGYESLVTLDERVFDEIQCSKGKIEEAIQEWSKETL